MLVEHYAGAFPAWMAPVQAAVLPVAEEHYSHARVVVDRLRAAGFRVSYERPDNPLGKRIRDTKTQKIPYVLVVGGDDVAHDTLGVNPRGGEVERDVAFDDFVARLTDEVEARR